MSASESSDCEKNIDQPDADTCADIIDKLIGNNILFFSLGTTGIPTVVDKSAQNDYTDNSMFTKSRIVCISWYYCENFSKENFNFNADDVRSIIRKPINFNTISPDSTKLHGITYEQAIGSGTLIKNIFNGDFGTHLMNCDLILGYNSHLN